MTNVLSIIQREGKFYVDSREVAEMTGKEHKHLLRDIKGYLEILDQSNFGPVEFFLSSEYQDAKGEIRPCYFLTRKGCDMVANKMTGKKGVLFTAAYVTKFEEMEKTLQTVYSYMIEDPVARARKWADEQEEQIKLLKQKDAEIHELQESSGLTSLMITRAVNAAINHLRIKYGHRVYSSGPEYQDAKDRIFKHFGVTIWEQIPKYRYDDLIKFINTL